MAIANEFRFPFVLAATCLSLGFGVAAAVVAGDAQHLWWHVGTIAMAFIAFVAPSRLPKQIGRTIPTVAFGWVLLITVPALVNASIGLYRFGEIGRASLLFGGPNLYGAVLAIAGTVHLILGELRWKSLGVGLVLPSLFLAGSRTAVVAYVLGVALWLLADRRRHCGRRPIVIVLIAFGVAVGVAGALAVHLSGSASRNLLRYSESFNHPAWITRYASWIVFDTSFEVPAEADDLAWELSDLKARVTRVSGSTDPKAAYPNLLLFQNVGTSVEGELYVASLYLRADEPVTLRLSSNLGVATCDVTSSWQRCATPARAGNGTTLASFQLSTVDPGEEVTFYVWGAQLERAEVPTRPESTSRNALLSFIASGAERLVPTSWAHDTNLGSRLSVYQSAWRAFLAKPIAGHGIGATTEGGQGSARTNGLWPHTHNLVLQMLVVGGVLGLLSWALVFLGYLASLSKRALRGVAPLVFVVAILNVTDYTYHNRNVYYPYWLAIGAVVVREVSVSNSREDEIDGG